MSEFFEHGPLTEFSGSPGVEDLANLFSGLDNFKGDELLIELEKRLTAQIEEAEQFITDKFLTQILNKAKEFAAKIDGELGIKCLSLTETVSHLGLHQLDIAVTQIRSEIREKILSKIVNKRLWTKEPAEKYRSQLTDYFYYRKKKETIYPNRRAYIKKLFELKNYSLIAHDLSITYKELQIVRAQHQNTWNRSQSLDYRLLNHPSMSDEEFEIFVKRQKQLAEVSEKTLIIMKNIIELLSPNFAGWLLSGVRLLSDLEIEDVENPYGSIGLANKDDSQTNLPYTPLRFSQN